MEKSTELSIEMYELDKNELIETNGGLIGLSFLGLWCGYLLDHDAQLMNGISDAWKELTGTN